MNNREADQNPHPPSCSCVDCVDRRLGKHKASRHCRTTKPYVPPSFYADTGKPLYPPDKERITVTVHHPEPTPVPPACPSLHQPQPFYPDPPPPPRPPSNPWVPLFFILLIGAIVVIVAVSANSNHQTPTPPPPTAVPSSSASPKPTPPPSPQPSKTNSPVLSPPIVKDIIKVDRSPFIGTDIVVTVSTIPNVSAGLYLVRLLSGAQVVGETELDWASNTIEKSLDFHIDETDAVFARLKKGESPSDIFKADISLKAGATGANITTKPSTSPLLVITPVKPPWATPAPSASIPLTPTKPTLTALKDPTWNQLLSFLQADNTDSLPYIYPTFVCDDFANTLQANARKAGWRCAKVTLEMTGYTDPYHYGIAPNAGHSCNAFQTTDRGLVYIDDTGLPASNQQRPHNCDKVVSVAVGKRYVPQSLFPEPGWNTSWEDMGAVTGINIRW